MNKNRYLIGNDQDLTKESNVLVYKNVFFGYSKFTRIIYCQQFKLHIKDNELIKTNSHNKIGQRE